MRVQSRIKAVFAFAHHVHTPHYHPDAFVDVVVSSDLMEDPDSHEFMWSQDFTALRKGLERRLGEHVAGRLLVWERELDQARAAPIVTLPGVVIPPLVETTWPVPPTLEMIAARVALLVEELLAGTDNHTAQLEELYVFEAARAGCGVTGGDLQQLLAVSRKWFGRAPVPYERCPGRDCRGLG